MVEQFGIKISENMEIEDKSEASPSLNDLKQSNLLNPFNKNHVLYSQIQPYSNNAILNDFIKMFIETINAKTQDKLFADDNKLNFYENVLLNIIQLDLNQVNDNNVNLHKQYDIINKAINNAILDSNEFQDLNNEVKEKLQQNKIEWLKVDNKLLDLINLSCDIVKQIYNLIVSNGFQFNILEQSLNEFEHKDKLITLMDKVNINFKNLNPMIELYSCLENLISLTKELQQNENNVYYDISIGDIYIKLNQFNEFIDIFKSNDGEPTDQFAPSLDLKIYNELIIKNVINAYQAKALNLIV